MKNKLTKLAVGKLAPEAGKRLEVFDTLTPGLAPRMTEAGKKSWSVMYRVAGRGGRWKPGRAAADDLGRSSLDRPEGATAQHPPVIDPFSAACLRKERPDPPHLRLGQPKTLAHETSPFRESESRRKPRVKRIYGS